MGYVSGKAVQSAVNGGNNLDISWQGMGLAAAGGFAGGALGQIGSAVVDGFAGNGFMPAVSKVDLNFSEANFMGAFVSGVSSSSLVELASTWLTDTNEQSYGQSWSYWYDSYDNYTYED